MLPIEFEEVQGEDFGLDQARDLSKAGENLREDMVDVMTS